MSAQPERHPRTFWKRLVAELARGATLESTAERHGVRPKTLSWWRWTLRREQAAGARLLPVVLRAEPARVVAAHYEPISIDVRADISFRVPVGSDVEYVAALVAAVRSSSC